MKKRTKHRIRMSAAVLLAATVLCVGDLGLLRQAAAGTQVRAVLRGPYVSVRIGTRPTEVRRPFVYRVTSRDRAIARELALRTGFHQGILLDMRARGFSWMEVGHRLGISPRMVRLVVYSDGRQHHHRRVRIAGHKGPVGRCGPGR